MKTFTPFKHQQMMVDHHLDRHKAGFFAGPGLGKTSATLKVCDEFFRDGTNKGVLVIAPINICNHTWKAEVNKWAFAKTMKIANMRTKEGVEAWKKGSADIYTMNYESAHKLDVMMDQSNIPVNHIIFDESHNWKKPCTKFKKTRAQYFYKHSHHFDQRTLLTGTPNPSGYEDIFAQIKLLDEGDTLGEYITHFREKYFIPEHKRRQDGQAYTKWDLRKGADEEINKLIEEFIITLKSEDYLDIPDVTYHDIPINLTGQVMKKYKELEKHFLLEIDKYEIEAQSSAVLRMKLVQLTTGSIYDEDREVVFIHDLKMRAARKIYDKLHKQGENVLMVYSFQHEKAMIEKFFPEAEFFDGDRIDDWNAGKIPLWVSQNSQIKEGLNLQDGGCNLIWTSIDDDYAKYKQLNARIARTGQTEKTNIYRLIGIDTVDEAISMNLAAKENREVDLFDAIEYLKKMRNRG